MRTHPPVMTTEQLIEACAHDGVIVSGTQLARWVRAGLIPASLRVRHGRGRGKGTEWLWEAECLPRVRVVARTLQDSDPSFSRAALMLAAAGYAPAPKLLRTVLLDGLTNFERLAKRRQSYLQRERPIAWKRQQHRKNMRRHMASYPTPILDSMVEVGEILYGLAQPPSIEGSGDPPEQVNAGEAGIAGDAPGAHLSLSLSEMRERLERIDDQTLLANYQLAGEMADNGARVWDFIVSAQDAFLPSWGGTRDVGASDEQRVLGFTHEAANALFRLIYTVLISVMPVSDEQQVTTLQSWLLGLMAPIEAYAKTPWPLVPASHDLPDAEKEGIDTD